MFISEHYKRKIWTNHERESAQARAIQQQEDYILPYKIDNTEIPGVRLTTGYLSNKSPEQLAYFIAKKVNPDLDIMSMIEYLKRSLQYYEIYIEGTKVVFRCEKEDYYGEFPLRLLLEMYKLDQLDYMFLTPAIVPW